MTTAPSSIQHGRLSAEQVARYRREGYLIFDEPILPPAEFAALCPHFESKLAALPPAVRPEAMDVPHFTDPALFRWLFSPVYLARGRDQAGNQYADPTQSYPHLARDREQPGKKGH